MCSNHCLAVLLSHCHEFLALADVCQIQLRVLQNPSVFLNIFMVNKHNRLKANLLSGFCFSFFTQVLWKVSSGPRWPKHWALPIWVTLMLSCLSLCGFARIRLCYHFHLARISREASGIKPRYSTAECAVVHRYLQEFFFSPFFSSHSLKATTVSF